MKIIVGITGASGSLYARNLLKIISNLYQQIEECVVIISDNGYNVWKYELESDPLDFINSLSCSFFRIASNHNLFDKVSSGSNIYNCMIIIPCSMATIGKINCGISDTLITRAADVMLKEKRLLVVVPREAPYNAIHLKNMLELTTSGAVIFPASPFFYNKPSNIEQMVDSFSRRILSLCGINVEHFRWNEEY